MLNMSSHVSKHTGNLTSFKKRGADSLNIRGARISAQNAQLLTSTGSSTLDFFISGGLAIGTICVIEEDRYNTYSSILLKYFLAEGIANKHRIFLSSGEKPSKDILKELPSIRVPGIKHENNSVDSSQKDSLKIAWRYQSQPSAFISGVKADSHNHGYDLSKSISEEALLNSSINTWDPASDVDMEVESLGNFITSPYTHLLERIASEIASGGYKTSSKAPDNIMRIGVATLGSPLWNTSSKSEEELNIVRFLYLLKALLRSSFAVAVVTIPSYLMQNKVLISRIRQMSDTVIGLESFVGSDKKSNPLFKEFDGLLQVVKLPVLNTFMYPTRISDLAFKLKRKDFVIERLHLPPEFEDSQEPSSFGCSGQPSKLDF